MSNAKPLPFWIFLGLTVVCGIIINAPFHNFQNFLSQGDHGRDLYAAQAVLRGELPYKDFWWVYGPLMPYYYGLFFKIFGVAVPSVLLGKIFLNIAAGVFFFLAFARLFSPAAAFIAASWFLNFHSDFFFTYNHAGGITLLLAIVWMHCAFLQTGRSNFLWAALPLVFILGLIKINFALTALAMTVGLALVQGLRQRDFMAERPLLASAVLGLPLTWFAVYTVFLQGLSAAEVRQCLPYLGGDEPYNTVGPWQTLPILAHTIWRNITAGWADMAVCGLVILCGIQTALMVCKRTLFGGDTAKFWLLAGYLGIFYVLNLHEFLKSGVFYRAFWSQPLSMFLMFAIIAIPTATLGRWVRLLLWLSLGLILILSVWNNTSRINAYKDGQHFLGSPRGQVHIANDRAWLQTVVLTTRQLQTVLKDNELFLALPYDCLYYYLTGKPSPTRQLIFFDHINIPAEQEERIIGALENHKTAMVLVSSRQSARERGLGTFGETYCPLMAQYIESNFTPVAKIGDWVNEPGWAWNHGTLLFKRK